MSPRERVASAPVFRDSLTPMPSGDERIDLPDPQRIAIGKKWESRIHSELAVGLSFDHLTHQLAAVGADSQVIALARRSAVEEQAHGKLCQQMAARYLGQDVAFPSLDNWRPISFGHNDAGTEALFHAVGQCCISETIAVAYLKLSLDLCTDPVARRANQYHLREEISHARIGWAHLASPTVNSSQRATLRTRLNEMIEVNRDVWLRAGNFLPGDAAPAHGYPTVEQGRQAVRQAVDTIIIPGFELVFSRDAS